MLKRITTTGNYFPFNYYRDMFEEQTGRKLLAEEKVFLTNFANRDILSSSKQVYYYALFYYKRFYPLFLIRILIRKKVKLMLIKQKAPVSIQSLSNEIAEIILLTGMSAY
jgi:hypothetical protein